MNKEPDKNIDLNLITSKLNFKRFFKIINDFSIFIEHNNIGVFNDTEDNYYIASYEIKNKTFELSNIVKLLNLDESYVLIKYECINKDLYYIADFFTDGKLNTNILKDLGDL